MMPANDDFAAALARSLPEDTLRRAEPRYLCEPRGRWQGGSGWVALPRRVEEVAQIVSACNEAHVPIVPYGGGTGLVGGQICDFPVLILSLERTNAIRAFYPQENTVIAEAGVILADLRAAANHKERLFALSLASEGSARIGGLLSTNAGGVNTLRYGNARDQVLGIEAVLPDGQILRGLKRLRKDNTGYDLRHLLIGAEGSLGVITAAALKLAPRPARSGTALLRTPSPQAALDLYCLAQEEAGETISAFELMARTSFDFLRETLPDLRLPWEHLPDWAVLIELGVGADQDPQDLLERIFSRAHDAGLVDDGLVAQSSAQTDMFWGLRERIPEANRLIGSIASHDIALPLDAIPGFISRAPEVLASLGVFRINCFGHLGDGNLHYNVFPAKGRRRDDYDNAAQISEAVHGLVMSLQGSFSAEHGLGRLKPRDLERYGDPAKLHAMRAIKAALDPKGLMNPGAVL